MRLTCRLGTGGGPGCGPTRSWVSTGETGAHGGEQLPGDADLALAMGALVGAVGEDVPLRRLARRHLFHVAATDLLERLAREEIFGPVITILGARDEADAVRIANDTPYGLAGYVSAGSVESANRVGRQIRAGNVNLNGVPNERTAPFGGYKQSGNGREWGKFGMEEFLEVKAIAGANPS